MGKFDVFDIELGRAGPYLSGESVTGHLLLRSKKERTIARIVIHVCGSGRVEFTEDRAAAVRPTPTVYQDSQTYLRLSQVLMDRQSLAKGQVHRLGFELRLPERLPSSFMTLITYSLAALVERSGSPTKSCALTRPIVVIGDVDLNRLSAPGSLDLWQPIDVWGHWRSGSGQQQQLPQQQLIGQRLDDTGLVTARLQADKRAFAIGEAIRLRVEVRNSCKMRLESIRACLTQKSEYRAAAADGTLARREQRLAVQHSRLQERLKPGACLLEEDAQLPVPWLATAVASAGCRLLRVRYFLQVICALTPELSPVVGMEAPVQALIMGPKFDKCERVLVLLEEPVTIGTRPLVAANTAATALPIVPTVQPSAPPDFLQDLTMFTMMPSAPPSYEESLMAQQVRGNWGQYAAGAGNSKSG